MGALDEIRLGPPKWIQSMEGKRMPRTRTTTESIPEPNSTTSDLEAGSSKKISNIASVSDFQPLEGIGGETRKRYQKLAERAARNPLDAIKLNCIECNGWDYPEAKRCEIKRCPLW